MREKEMNEVAEIISRVISGREAPRLASKRVVTLERKFRRVYYA
jgi:glycine/serine hydroxymethyltransferase